MGYQASSAITASYATGDVSGGDGNVGGLVGEQSDSTITASYAIGGISGSGGVGGLVGAGSTTTVSFWDIDSSGQAGSACGKGLTTVQMQSLTVFQNVGWGRHGWVMENGQYPRLAWEGTGADPIPAPDPLAGTGTEIDPYRIGTVEEFASLSWHEGALNAHILLIQDLDLEGVMLFPIGVDLGPFNGTFDGDGYVLRNATIEGNASYVGIFSRVGTGATIRNVGIENISVSGIDYVGGLVGYQEGGTITNSYVTGSVSGSWCVGGLVGRQMIEGTITASYSTASVSGGSDVGGLVGNKYGSTTITASYATGEVSGGNNVGGLVGSDTDGTITASYATGDVDCDWYVGGLVGHSFSTITASYATGSVSGSGYVGGLVGRQGSGTIAASYATGPVSGTYFVGGLVGQDLNNTITASYWDIQRSGQPQSAGGEGRTTDEMIYPYAANTYAGWDFEETWAEDSENLNAGYPYLGWQEAETQDTTPPAIGCPSEMIVGCAREEGEAVAFDIHVADDLDPNPTVTVTPESGSVFPAGETTDVYIEAADASGNSNGQGFPVTVVPCAGQSGCPEEGDPVVYARWEPDMGNFSDGMVSAVSTGAWAAAGFYYDQNAGETRLFRWARQGDNPYEVQTVGPSFDGGPSEIALSADGSAIVGQIQLDGSRWEAFRWTEGSGFQTLGLLPDGNGSAALGVSADGAVVVGTAGLEAFRWTEADGMQGLG